MDEAHIEVMAERVAGQYTAARLQLGPRKKTRGIENIAWYQDFKFDPEGWALETLMKKITRYLKKPPTKKLRGYSGPTLFIQFKTSRGTWPVFRWDSKTIKTYDKLVEQGKLTGKGTGGWSFKKQ